MKLGFFEILFDKRSYTFNHAKDISLLHTYSSLQLLGLRSRNVPEALRDFPPEQLIINYFYSHYKGPAEMTSSNLPWNIKLRFFTA